MPRKSKSLRISQSKQLLESYTNLGIANDYRARFMKDMIFRMEHNRYPTKRQRDWLDSLIEEGAPTPQGDPVYISKIDEALKLSNFEFHHVLKDFKGKLISGRTLSEKQINWCDKLLSKVNSIQNGTHWSPSEKTIERLKTAVSVKCCYSSGYWDSHQGSFRALNKASEYIEGNLEYIDETTVHIALKGVAGKLREMEKPKFKPGQMAYHDNIPSMVLEGPIPTRTGIGYDILINGEVKRSYYLKKRFLKPKTEKSYE